MNEVKDSELEIIKDSLYEIEGWTEEIIDMCRRLKRSINKSIHETSKEGNYE